MAWTKTTLLLFVCLGGCAFTLALNDDGLQKAPNSLTATGDICEDCTKIVELLTDMIANPDLQKRVMSGIDSLCDHLPGPTSQMCKDEVEKMLPVAITFITGFVKPAEVCKIIGLCGTCQKQQKMIEYLVSDALQAAAANGNGLPDPHCTFCVFFVKTLEGLLPKDRTEGAVIELLEEICNILPASYRDQCDGVVEKFGKTVIDAILGYATPQNVCALLHMCKGQETLLVDPCTLPTFRCKDMKTALKCGSLFYCQRFVWKPLNYSKL